MSDYDTSKQVDSPDSGGEGSVASTVRGHRTSSLRSTSLYNPSFRLAPFPDYTTQSVATKTQPSGDGSTTWNQLQPACEEFTYYLLGRMCDTWHIYHDIPQGEHPIISLTRAAKEWEECRSQFKLDEKGRDRFELTGLPKAYTGCLISVSNEEDTRRRRIPVIDLFTNYQPDGWFKPSIFRENGGVYRRGADETFATLASFGDQEPNMPHLVTLDFTVDGLRSAVRGMMHQTLSPAEGLLETFEKQLDFLNNVHDWMSPRSAPETPDMVEYPKTQASSTSNFINALNALNAWNEATQQEAAWEQAASELEPSEIEEEVDIESVQLPYYPGWKELREATQRVEGRREYLIRAENSSIPAGVLDEASDIDTNQSRKGSVANFDWGMYKSYIGDTKMSGLLDDVQRRHHAWQTNVPKCEFEPHFIPILSKLPESPSAQLFGRLTGQLTSALELGLARMKEPSPTPTIGVCADRSDFTAEADAGPTPSQATDDVPQDTINDLMTRMDELKLLVKITDRVKSDPEVDFQDDQEGFFRDINSTTSSTSSGEVNSISGMDMGELS